MVIPEEDGAITNRLHGVSLHYSSVTHNKGVLMFFKLSSLSSFVTFPGEKVDSLSNKVSAKHLQNIYPSKEQPAISTTK